MFDFLIVSGVKKLLIHTSCEYVSQCISKWIDLWQRTDWTTSRGSPVKNRDILEELIKFRESIDIKAVNLII